jgi:hypothetical protein
VLKEAGCSFGDIAPLLTAGLGYQEVITLLQARLLDGDFPPSTWIQGDARFHARFGDAELLLAAARGSFDTDALADLLEPQGPLTRDDVLAAAELGLSLTAAGLWADSGRAVGELATLSREITSMAPAVLVHALLNGVTTSDLLWLDGLGVRLDEVIVLYGVGGTSFAAFGEGQRRLVLLLVAVPGFSSHAACALAVLAGEAPWLDVAARLIADGSRVDDALRLARADHSIDLEQQASRLISVAPAGRGPQPGVVSSSAPAPGLGG